MATKPEDKPTKAGGVREMPGTHLTLIGSHIDIAGGLLSIVGSLLNLVGRDLTVPGSDSNFPRSEMTCVGRKYNFVGSDFNSVGSELRKLSLQNIMNRHQTHLIHFAIIQIVYQIELYIHQKILKLIFECCIFH